MKIGILTLHYAHNYGAVWQAYALRFILENMGHKVEIINYRNRYIEETYRVKLNSYAEIKRRNGKIYSPMVCREEYQKRQKFNDFIDSILLRDKVDRISLKELEYIDVDAFISGSDQIWTWWLTGGYDKAYLLDFDTKAKRVAYAASMYDTNILKDKSEYLKAVWRRYDSISVRESAVQNFVAELAGVNVERVLDPTLLISEQEYINLAEPITTPPKYILVYYLFEDERLDLYAQTVADKMGAVIVELHYVGYKKKRGRIQRSAVSPTEFISYIKNAEYVVTNSFHGCAFSIIFRKNFVAVYDDDDRKNNLLQDVGLGMCHVKYYRQGVNLPSVDYDLVYKRVGDLREYAKAFLIHSLQ